MAGDWIKMRIDLHEDPAIIQMADALNVREEVVVGYCHKIWGWVSRQCHAPSVTGVTLLSLGRVTNLPGFPELLVEVGWLEYDDSGDKPVITIPHFDRHLSQTAKRRALASERKRQNRAECHAPVAEMSRSERDKSVTREEKRREEKKSVSNKLDTHGRSKKDATDSGGRARRVRFVPPTREQVLSYANKIGYPLDPDKFLAHYESKGWVVGKAKMRSWQAALRNWKVNGWGRAAGNGQAEEDLLYGPAGRQDDDKAPF